MVHKSNTTNIFRVKLPSCFYTMESAATVSALDTARRLKNDAYSTSDRNQALRNFMNASKIYLREIENVNDRQTKASLAFLAKASIYDAIFATSDIHHSRPDEVQEQRDSDALLLYHNRVIEGIRQQRLGGLQQIPKGVEPLPSQVLQDIQHMEKKLSELGLKKPPPPKTANEQAKRALGNIASTLGESFMVLHDDTSSSAKENLNLDYSVISLPTVNAQHLPHHQQQTLRNQPPRTDSKAAAPTPQSYQTSIIPFWSRPVTAVPPSVPASVPSSSNNPQSAIEGLDWNTQSFMTTNHYGTAAVHSHHLPQPPSQSHVGKDTSSYNLHDEATVQNLLDTISKLRSENEQLLSQNRQVSQDMAVFRHEYDEKLQEIKHSLRKDQLRPPEKFQSSSTSSSSTLSSTPSSILDSAEKLNQALEVALRREKKYQQRHADLEKIVMGLTKKYDAILEESRKKDALIQKLQQQVQYGSSADLLSASTSSISSPVSPMNTISPTGNLSPGNPRSTIAAPNQTGLVGTAGVSAASLGQIGTYPHIRRPISSTRHPSTSTLESLQKSTKYPPPK